MLFLVGDHPDAIVTIEIKEMKEKMNPKHDEIKEEMKNEMKSLKEEIKSIEE